jgi:hypothetical protein
MTWPLIGRGSLAKLILLRHALGLTYVAAIQANTKARLVREDDPKPPRVSVEALALSLSKSAWCTVTWREATNKKLRSGSTSRSRRSLQQRTSAQNTSKTLLRVYEQI